MPGYGRVHSLRDTFITRLARQGVPLDRRMKLSGHRDPNMNLAYGEVEPESLREAIDSLEMGAG